MLVASHDTKECKFWNVDSVNFDELRHLFQACTVLFSYVHECCVHNVSFVAPDCLAILKIVHELTERLIHGTLQTDQQQLLHSPEILAQLVSVARRIVPRVDDVVSALYPPLDPRLLEARLVRLCD